MRPPEAYDRDAFVRLGRFVRNAFLATKAFIEALLDSEAWARFGRRVFKRVVLVVLVGMVFSGITWKYSAEILQWLLVPAEGKLTPFEGGLPVFTAPAEMFGVTVNLAFRGGLIAAFPVAVVSIYTLVSKWLPSPARTFIKIFVPSLFLAFIAGVAFVYYVVLPASLKFLLNFGEGVAVPLITVTDYYELALSLMFWVGVLFELPLAMYLLARLGLVSYRKLKWFRLAAWFFAPILAAIITPSFDAMTWTLVMVPLIVLYEFGLFLAWAAHPDQGNYLLLGSLARFIKRIWTAVTYPLRPVRWAWRKMRRR